MLLTVPTKVEETRTIEARAWANGIVIVVSILAFVFLQTPAWYLVPGVVFWNISTDAFSHASPWHLIGHIYVLLVVGSAVNRRIGNGHCLLVYFGTVLAMGLAGRMLGVSPFMGSSCAIYSLVGVMLMLLPAAIVHIGYAALFPKTLLNDFSAACWKLWCCGSSVLASLVHGCLNL